MGMWEIRFSLFKGQAMVAPRCCRAPQSALNFDWLLTSSGLDSMTETPAFCHCRQTDFIIIQSHQYTLVRFSFSLLKMCLT